MPKAVRGLRAVCTLKLLPAVSCVTLSAAGMLTGGPASTQPAPPSVQAPAAPAPAVQAPAVQTPAAQTPAADDVTPVCDQDVPPGHFACLALRRTTPGSSLRTGQRLAAQSMSPSFVPAGLHPADLASAYSLPTATGGVGQTIYVIDAFGYPNAESDLGMYRSQFGLPPCTTANGCFSKLNQRGAAGPYPAPDNDWAGESALDLDMVSAICPNCHITLIESDDDSENMLVAAKEAQTLGAKFVSMSWGGAELGYDAQLDSAYFAPTGVVYTASSGDGGFAKGPIYPATSNRVVAVGGTSLARSSNARGWSESAWAGAGSGCSDEEARPAWQASVTACSRRGTTDVSAVANPNQGGVSVYISQGDTGWDIFGGTSAAAPIIAGVYALAGAPASNAHPASYLYQHRGSLYDITTGSNGSCEPATLCHAAAGWDGPTGLGTPHGLTAFADSRASSPTSVISPQHPATGVQPGGSVLPPGAPRS